MLRQWGFIARVRTQARHEAAAGGPVPPVVPMRDHSQICERLCPVVCITYWFVRGKHSSAAKISDRFRPPTSRTCAVWRVHPLCRLRRILVQLLQTGWASLGQTVVALRRLLAYAQPIKVIEKSWKPLPVRLSKLALGIGPCSGRQPAGYAWLRKSHLARQARDHQTNAHADPNGVKVNSLG